MKERKNDNLNTDGKNENLDCDNPLNSDEDQLFEENDIIAHLPINQYNDKSPYVAKGDAIISYNLDNKHYTIPNQLVLNKDEQASKYNVKEEAFHYASMLIKDRFIIINCAHSGITNSLKYNIAQNNLFDKSFIKTNGLFQCKNEIDFIHYIKDCREKKLGKSKNKLLLFIHDDSNYKKTQLSNHLKNKTKESKKHIIDCLKQDIYIVYFTHNSDSHFLINSQFEPNIHKVESFEIYCKGNRFSKSLIGHIKDRIKEGFLSKNEKECLEDLDKRVEDSDFEDYILSLGNNGISFDQLFKSKESPLARYVFIVATLFPRLSPEIFREYIQLLIQDKKKVKVSDSKISLLELWDEDADIILEECGLRSYEIDSQYCIDFATSEDAERCKKVVYKYANFVDQKSRLLIEKKQLFQDSTSLNSHYSIYPAIAHLTTLFKSYYGEYLPEIWLSSFEAKRIRVFELISTIEDLRSYRSYIQKLINKFSKIRFNEDLLQIIKKINPINFKQDYKELLEEYQLSKFIFVKQEQLPENISVKDILKDLQNLKNDLITRTNNTNNELNKIRHSLGKYIFLFVDLLIEINEKDNTKTVILNFFDSACQSLHRNLIILDILNEFHSKSNIDNFFQYYKQALKNTSRDTNEIACHALIRFTLNNPSSFYSSLIKIKDWFPKESKSIEELSQLEKLSLRFLYHLLSIQMNRDEESSKDDVINSNTYQMLFEHSKEFQNHIAFVIINMFKHLDVLEISLKRDGLSTQNIVENYQYEITQLIQSWYSLLYKLEIKNTKEKTPQEKTSLLIDAILKVLSAKQHKIILKNFKIKRGKYNHQISTIKNSEEKQKIKEERGHLIKLITLLKN